ncbi:MAG TPA: hypothetical protein VNS09_08120 [Solirubrobacter sp.]|nr:hypothetical protein [Solirubrobacter sp.]
MSAFPELEAALDEAARRLYGRRRRWLGLRGRVPSKSRRRAVAATAHATATPLGTPPPAATATPLGTPPPAATASPRGAAARRGARAWLPRAVAALACAGAVVVAVALVRAEPERAAAPPTAAAPVAVPAHTLALSRALAAAPAIAHDADRTVIPHAELPAIAAAEQARTPYPPGQSDTFDWAATPADPRDMTSINYRAEVTMLVQFRAACIWLRYWTASAGEQRAAATQVLTDAVRWPALRKLHTWSAVPAQAAAGNAAALAERARLDCR